ncbi:hypothetical protein Peur_029258 [Populus x canadensis]
MTVGKIAVSRLVNYTRRKESIWVTFPEPQRGNSWRRCSSTLGVQQKMFTLRQNYKTRFTIH